MASEESEGAVVTMMGMVLLIVSMEFGDALGGEQVGDGCWGMSEGGNEPGVGQMTAVMTCFWLLESPSWLFEVVLLLLLLLLAAAAAAAAAATEAAAARMSLAKLFVCWRAVVAVAAESEAEKELRCNWSEIAEPPNGAHLLLAADCCCCCCCWLLGAGCVMIRLGLIRKDLGILCFCL